MATSSTSALTYNLYITQVATMTVVNVTTVNGVVQGVDDGFNNLIPQMLNYAELRIQRDLDMVQSQMTDATSYALASPNPQLAIPINDFQVLQTVGVMANGMAAPLRPVTKEFLQNVYPLGSTPGTPIYFAMIGGDTATTGGTFLNIAVGPVPDQDYPLVLTGTRRMQTLATFATPADADTATTFLSAQMPDLLLQASMIYVSQFQRNFGPTSNDPQMGPSYEAQYQALLRGSAVEEARKRFWASGWTSQSAPVAATPTRG